MTAAHSYIFLCAFWTSLFSVTNSHALPNLILSEELTWNDVFEAGFRPKHLKDLERKRCISFNSGFSFRLNKDAAPLFFTEGRTSFDVLRDHKIWEMRHQETKSISLEEGRRRFDDFISFAGTHLKKKGVFPQVIDRASGKVDAGGPTDDSFAVKGTSRIHFGFENSYISKTPLIAYLAIYSTEISNIYHGPYGPGEKIPPPKGYEWYSLDPKVDTPSPGEVIEYQFPYGTTARSYEEGQRKPAPKEADKRPPPKPKTEPAARIPFWIYALILSLSGIGIVILVRQRNT